MPADTNLGCYPIHFRPLSSTIDYLSIETFNSFAFVQCGANVGQHSFPYFKMTWRHSRSSDAIFGESSIRAYWGSLSNHDDDGNKNLTNLHIWQWKTGFLHALHVHFSSFDILNISRSFYDVKWPVLQLCGRREHMMTNVNFCPLMSQELVPI